MPDQAVLLRVAPLLFVALWSTGFIAAKYSMGNADPFVFLCLRFTITVFALIPILVLNAATSLDAWFLARASIGGPTDYSSSSLSNSGAKCFP